MTLWLPLFPLNTVLFPGMRLSLQIFEARYLDMVSRCLRDGAGFGVVSLMAGAEAPSSASATVRFAALGCEARIIDFDQRDNGLLGITVQGVRRFIVRDTEVNAANLNQAQVDWLSEEEPLPLQREHTELAAIMQALAEHPSVKALGMPSVADSQQALSYALAYLLPLEQEHKLELLSLNHAAERLARIEELIAWMQH
ncbi:LON peptidase substrate-binding domain-containing protein [Atopomonas sediminilitoris]|uniref:LON peptidase substrate-binding domain-containing protein n=1 Tax=Atopomonas sediminilitoris TaxID=2919919 RepID=UPI001F4E6128|nr:LON peptidase substrate-binding domain-containing protein [Atopomonas sediminilitoris]MCJ8170609.1 LON peptidase substrate-binding domain-containing protein [Atopomonas sediminilitoris]